MLQTAGPAKSRSFLLLVGALFLAHSSIGLAEDAAPDSVQGSSADERGSKDSWGWTVGMTPFQLALLNPLQIFSPETPVRGLRINVLSGEQESVWGLDVGLAQRTTSDMRGLQLGLVNLNKDFWGVQQGLVNWSDGDFSGIQSSYIASRVGGNFTGLQMGIFANVVGGSLDGVQLSPISWNVISGSLNGVQLGGINWVDGVFSGFQLAPITNRVAGDFAGLQIGAFANVVGGSFAGVQLGALNFVEEDLTGVQLGFVNSVRGDSRSFQLGFWNQAESLKGLQIGLINVNSARSDLLFIPIVNVGW